MDIKIYAYIENSKCSSNIVKQEYTSISSVN